MFSHFSNASEVQNIIFTLMAISARVLALFCLANSQERRHFALTVVITHQKLSSLRRIHTPNPTSVQEYLLLLFHELNYLDCQVLFSLSFSLNSTASPSAPLVTFPKILKQFLSILHQNLMHHFI